MCFSTMNEDCVLNHVKLTLAIDTRPFTFDRCAVKQIAVETRTIAGNYYCVLPLFYSQNLFIEGNTKFRIVLTNQHSIYFIKIAIYY